MKKKYSDDFKADAVAKVIEAKHAGASITELAKTLGIGDALLHSWAARAKKQNKEGLRRRKRASYPLALKQRAAQMVRSGMTCAAVARELQVDAARVVRWSRDEPMRGVKGERDKRAAGRVLAVLPEVIPKPVNGIGSGGEITDALIYLRHAERAIIEMVRDAKISRPDEAHLLTLLALATLQKGINK